MLEFLETNAAPVECAMDVDSSFGPYCGGWVIDRIKIRGT